jgi:hypothetical protein
MILVALVFAAALALEGLGSWISIIGLSALFGANPIIIGLAAALDLGKVVTVSLAYQHWDRMPKLMRGYALLAAFVTMVITSAGAAGYLSGEFQKAMLGAQEGTVQVDALKAQQAKYEERKRQIDDQIARLPEKTSVGQRVRLINQFKAEQAELQAKIAAIDRDLPALQVKQLGVEAKTGPILYVAKAFDTTPEQAVRWVIFTIILVFDPLAVFLLVAGNFLLRLRAERPAAPEYVSPAYDPEYLEKIRAEVRAKPMPRPEGVSVAPAPAPDVVVPVAAIEPPPEPEPRAPIFEVLHPTRRQPEPEPEAPPPDLFEEEHEAERADAFAGRKPAAAPLVTPHVGPAAPRAVTAPRPRSALDGVRPDGEVELDGTMSGHGSSSAETYRRSSR